MTVLFLLIAALFSLPLLAQGLPNQHWALQYFYDEADSRLNITDLVFPTPQRGIAAGWITETDPEVKPKPIALVTNDGGEHWDFVPLKDDPRSLFFLNDSVGWLVGEKAIWKTEESGRSWRKIADQKKPDSKLKPKTLGSLIMRVHFLDEQHGFAVGYQKTVLETHDGGRTWTPVAEAAKPSSNPAFTAYTQIAFDGPRGLIVGAAIPPRPDSGPFPSWMDPARAYTQRQVPTLTLLLQTHDAGEKWSSETAPLFGIVSSMHISGTAGLNVFTFPDSFEWPSEVYRMDLTKGGSERVFREKDRRVTSAALFPGPVAFLAAVEPPGRLNTAPIPGKVKMLSSTDLQTWREMDVDYRAVAQSIVLAGPDPSHVWAATDTGMILRLEKAPAGH